MKRSEFSRVAVVCGAALACVVGTVASPSAQAAVPLQFSGGSGAPLSITLPFPVVYTVTNSFPPFFGPNFVFDGVGDLFGTSFPGVTSTIAFSIDAGTPHAIEYVNSGVFVDSISGDDIYTAQGTPMDLPIGSVITLSAGTMTTTSNIAAPAPASGDYETWITGSNGYTISTFGVIPEPASLSLLAVGGITLLRRRARATRPQ